MRLRHIPGCEEFVAQSADVIHSPEQHRGNWKAFFGNDRPVELEIGMGKGQFIRKLSLLHPEVNYLGLERYETVLMKAIKRKADEDARLPEGTKRTNLFFLAEDAKRLPEIFAEGEVDRIYLNFSDPWPKARHAKKRLTHREFLEKYETVLAADGLLIQKTDNEGLFDFSLEELRARNWEILAETRDLQHSPMNEGNVMTEFERKFTTLGKPVLKLVAKRPSGMV